MNWQNILTLVVVLGAATFFVWRSSGTKKHNHDCNCGCAHEDETGAQKDKASL
jgi:hypothetical protein